MVKTASAPRPALRRRGENPIASLTWPIFIELLLQMLVGNADQIMVGWYDPNSVGAIGNANQITNLLLIVFSVVCTAATILISQYIGAEDTRRVNETYAVSLLVNGLFGLGMGLLLMALCGPIFTLMQVPPEIFGETCLYIRIIGGGMVFQSVFLTYTAFFRSSQLMKESMLISVAMNLLNIAGNAVFINGAFGLPTGGESLSYDLSQICIQSICNGFTLAVINTRVYANLFAMLSYMFASAVSQAAQVVVARLMGAEKTVETSRSVKRTLLAAVSISALVSTLLWVFCRPMLALFTQDAQVLELFQVIMLIEIPLELGRAVNLVMCRSLQACGDIRFPITICVISAWLTAVGGGLLLAVVFDLGLVGLWIAMACDECLRALLFLWRWHGGAWSRKRLLSM